jgi:hypothetical protein
MEQRPVPPGLQPYWNGSVQQFAEIKGDEISPEEQARHQIFSLLLMGIVYAKWNGNKYGEFGNYGKWRTGQAVGKSNNGEIVYRGGSYLGHNIAALAVDGEGRIIDFDFNHNQVYDSTVEHAESRLVRRVFALNQIYDPWYALDRDASTPDAAEGAKRARRDYARRNLFATSASEQPLSPAEEAETARQLTPSAPVPYSSVLKDVTIYTSLESCAQCSGIMCLGSVKDIVYLQWDQGQFLIGNIMWQATTAEKMGFTAPRPIRGDEFGFPYFQELNEANEQFEKEVGSNPFYEGPGSPPQVINSPAVTSFLCTDLARNIYGQATTKFKALQQAGYPTYKPSPSALTNQEVLVQAQDFLEWVSDLDSRGAPHRV